LSGVFLSYSRGDRDLAFRILRNLRALGVDVWWDEDMPGVDWQEELGRQINELAAVLVIWTPLSAASKNVRDEARLGQHTEKLVNVMVGVASPPFPFDRVNGLPLDGWTGRGAHGGWTRVVRTLDERLSAAGGSEPGSLVAALKQREQFIGRKTKEVAEAEAAFAEAQAADAASSDALDAARAEFAAAEGQLRSVIDMQAGPTLLRAAQQQLDAALAARTDAEQARRSSAAALSAASRSLSTAKSELERSFDESVAAAAPASERAAEPAPAEAKPSPPQAQPAPAATARPHQRPPRWQPLAIAAGAVVAVFAVGALALRSGAGHAPLAPSSSVPAPAAQAAVAPAAPPPVPIPPSLLGSWDLGLGCSNPVTFADKRGTLDRTFAGRTVSMKLSGSSSAGVEASAADGSRYQLRNGVLSVIPAGSTRPMSMTRCTG